MAKKYIDAEKLRTLLANRYEEITVPVLTHEGGLESFYRRSEIHDILKIIDSLQQEQPCNTCTNDKGCVACKDGELWEGKEQPTEDLEAEMDRFFEEMPVQEQENIFEDTYQMIARHFYELGKHGKEPVSEDLEEAAKKHSCYDEDCEGAFYEPIVRNAFIAGAEWQKSQMPMPEDTVIFQKGIEEGKRLMLEDAVEGKVILGAIRKELGKMPDSTELIAQWDAEREMLEQKDFRGDKWRLAQNAYFDGFGSGYLVQKEQILRIARDRYESAMTFVTGNPDVDYAIQLDRLQLVKIIEKLEDKK